MSPLVGQFSFVLLDKIDPLRRLPPSNDREIIERIICSGDGACCITLPVVVDTVHVCHFSACTSHGFQEPLGRNRLVAKRLANDSGHQFSKLGERNRIVSKPVGLTAMKFGMSQSHRRHLRNIFNVYPTETSAIYECVDHSV